MKKIIFSAILFVAVQSVKAKVWLVDNNANSPQPLTSLQAAIDTASAGDTIMVAGSPNSYGDANITKPLVLIGEGYNNPDNNNTIARTLYIQSSQVVVTGFLLSFRIIFDAANAPGNSISNILVERCYSPIGSYIFQGGPLNTFYLMKNITIRNSISLGGLAASQNTNHDWIQFDSLLIENSIFQFFNFGNFGANIMGATSIIFRNNIFIGQDGGNGDNFFHNGYNSSDFHDGIFYNNIFYACDPIGSVNCTFMNNLTYGNGSGYTLFVGAPFGTGSNDTLPGPVNNNIYSKDPLFVNYSGPPQSFYFYEDFHLSPGSPCIGTGVGGTDIGIYGGRYPFGVGAGPAFIPVIDSVNISNSAVPNGSQFYLKFKARAKQ